MSIRDNLQNLRRQIATVASACARDPAEIQLLAVSKTFPASAIEEAYQTGQRAFGENYVEEALDKIYTLEPLDINWHYIGPVQNNKTRKLAEHFDWVQGVSSLKTARRLSDQRPSHLAPLNICIQVNISQENSKSGTTPSEVAVLAESITGMTGIRLRGLMAIPKPSNNIDEQRAAFSSLRQLYEDLRHAGHALDTLSMGMTADMKAAIMEGSTMVRIGTAIFGPRQAKNNNA